MGRDSRTLIIPASPANTDLEKNPDGYLQTPDETRETSLESLTPQPSWTAEMAVVETTEIVVTYEAATR